MSSNEHHERSSSPAKRARRNLSPVWEHIEKNFELNKCICRVDGCNRTWGYDHSTGKLVIHLINDHSIKYLFILCFLDIFYSDSFFFKTGALRNLVLPIPLHKRTKCHLCIICIDKRNATVTNRSWNKKERISVTFS